MAREELRSGWGSALGEGFLCSFRLGTSFCTELFGSRREEDTQSEVFPLARTLESPGLKREGGIPRSISSQAPQNPGLDPDQRVLPTAK